MVIASPGLLFSARFYCRRNRLVRNGARKATLDYLRDYADKRRGNSDARTGGPIYYLYHRLFVAGSYCYFLTPASVHGDTSRHQTRAGSAALKNDLQITEIKRICGFFMRNVYA